MPILCHSQVAFAFNATAAWVIAIIIDSCFVLMCVYAAWTSPSVTACLRYAICLFSHTWSYTPRHHAITIAAVLPADWIVLAVGGFGYEAAVAATPRFLLAIPLFQLLGTIFTQRELTRSVDVVRAMRLTALIVLFSFTSACAWLWMACPGSTDACIDGSWVQYAAHFHDGSKFAQAMYWAVTTSTTTGYGDITAHRAIEGCCVLAVIVFGVVAYGYVLGEMAAAMVRSYKYCPRISDQADRQTLRR